MPEGGIKSASRWKHRAAFAAFFLGIVALAVYCYRDSSLPDRLAAVRPYVVGTLQWTMVNVNADETQADAHFLRFPDGTTMFIDVGRNNGRLLRWLRRSRIRSVDTVIISHPHDDHYGGLESLLRGGIPLRQVLVNLPRKDVCDTEIPWGCNYGHVLTTVAFVESSGSQVRSMKPGDVIFDKDGARLEVLYAFDGAHTPIGRTDINDTSVILRLTYGKTRVLFTGDLNLRLGEYLAQYSDQLRAEIVKVPHHGTEGTAPNSFYEIVKPFAALVPGPATLWNSPRSARLRKYFEEHRNIDTRINGIDGNVTVTIKNDGYTVESESGPRH